MFAIDQLLPARFADQPAGGLVALRYSPDGRPAVYHLGLNTSGNERCPRGVLVFSGNAPPTFIQPAGFCVQISESPIFGWSGEVTAVSDIRQNGPEPGDIVIAGGAPLICGLIAGGAQRMDSCFWDSKSGMFVEPELGDGVFVLKQWTINVIDSSKQLQRVFQFSSR